MEPSPRPVPFDVIESADDGREAFLVCGTCRAPIPRHRLSSILLFRDARTSAIESDEELWNMWRCATCGALLHVRDPLLCVDLSKEFCILIYDPREATETFAQIVEQKRTELRQRYPEALHYIADRMIVVTLEEDAINTLPLSKDVIANMIEGLHKANARKGKYRKDRVSAMCADYDAGSGAITLQGYEVSDELLHNPDCWDSDEAKLLRNQIMTLLPGEESSAESSPNAATASTDLDVDTLCHELMEIAHAYRYSPELEGPLPFEYGLALQISGSDIGEPDEASDGNVWPKAWLGPPLRSVLERIFSQAEKEAMPVDIKEPVTAEDTEPEHFAEISHLHFDAQEATAVRFSEEIRSISYLLDEGMVEEAFERAEIYASNATNEQPSVAQLIYGVAGLKKRYAFAPGLTIKSINSFLYHFKEVGTEPNIFSICAYAYGQLAAYEAARGSIERAVVANLSALSIYWILHSERDLASLGPLVVSQLFTLGRTEGAAREGYRLLRDYAVVSSMDEEDRINLLSSMSLFERPRFNVVMGVGTGQLQVQKLDPPDPVRASQAASFQTEASSGINNNVSAVFVLRLMDDENKVNPSLYRSVLVGSQFLNSLIKQLCISVNPQDRMQLALALLNIQQFTKVAPAGLVGLNALLLRFTAEALREDRSPRMLLRASMALALSCNVFVQAALEIDERCSKSLTGEGRAAAMVDVSLWLAAERTGSLGMRVERAVAGQSDWGHEITQALVSSYPLALETLNRPTEAVQVYRYLLPLQERQRAHMHSPDIHLLAQGWMKEGYVRMSRCLFAGYLFEDDMLRAVQAADALETHKARRTRERLFEQLEIEVPSWRNEPLLHVAARLPADSAIACLGIHPYTERIPGRWMFVGVPEGARLERAWAAEVAPGESLQDIHDWFRERMSEVSRQVSSRNVDENKFNSILNELMPETEVRERLLTLGRIIQPIDRSIRNLYLSTEQYAFQLPWAAALSLASGANTQVSVVPSSAFAVRGQAVSVSENQDLRGAIWCWGEDHALEHAAESMVNEIGYEADASWSFSLIAGRDIPESPQALDLLMVLSHGSKEAGVDVSGITGHLSNIPRIVLLLGCWSAFMEQHTRHMEIEGAVTELLERGTEIVIASVWPLPLTFASEFGTAYALALSSGTNPREAFSVARDLLSVGTGVGSHPAVWAGLTLFG